MFLIYFFAVALFYYTFTLKCFVLGVAAVSAELRAILLDKAFKTL